MQAASKVRHQQPLSSDQQVVQSLARQQLRLLGLQILARPFNARETDEKLAPMISGIAMNLDEVQLSVEQNSGLGWSSRSSSFIMGQLCLKVCCKVELTSVLLPGPYTLTGAPQITYNVSALALIMMDFLVSSRLI